MRRAWDEGTSTAGRLVDEWGEFISGFAPIVADDGQRVAIVGVDTSYDQFGAEGRHTRRAVLVGFLLTEILVATSMLAFFFNRRSLARIHALEDEMRRQNGQLRARGIYLG
jgi:sensor histidine kinase regulating citrate/malate metabolism